MQSESQPSAGDVQDLARQVGELRLRLAAVERKLAIHGFEEESGEEDVLEGLSLPRIGDTAATTTSIGISLLGLALAYLLRALAENGTYSARGGVALGLCYALAWLIWAARTPASETFSVCLRSLTSVLILAPLLWEATVRFQAISAWQTAGLLMFFSAFGLGISWRKNLNAVALISSVAGLLLAGALILRTHELIPYSTALLGLAAAVEISACLEHYLGERWIVAAVADLALVLTTFAAAQPSGSLPSYPVLPMGQVLALQIGLTVIYLASTYVRTLGRGFNIAVFEIAQCVAAAIIGSWGAITIAHGHAASVLTVGGFWSLCGIACYVVSFFFLERHAGKDRNFLTYSTFGLALVLIGSGFLLSGAFLVAFWSVLAVFFVTAGGSSGRMTLKVHSGVYALLSLFSSGLAANTASLFFSSEAHPDALAPHYSAWIAAAGCLAAYFLFLRAPLPPSLSKLGSRLYAAAALLLSASALWSLAGAASMAVAPLCRMLSTGVGARDFCPTLLTVTLIGTALLAACSAIYSHSRELRWFAWLFTAIASGKLLFQDFRQANTFAMVLSLIIYGSALICLPRILRREHNAAAGSGD
ncbi:MAG: hypothetical protein HY821_18270 [Acidobacteria bacterium]|nr:hypothetical protein [Acidobacteriota bacterium]